MAFILKTGNRVAIYIHHFCAAQYSRSRHLGLPCSSKKRSIGTTISCNSSCLSLSSTSGNTSISLSNLQNKKLFRIQVSQHSCFISRIWKILPVRGYSISSLPLADQKNLSCSPYCTGSWFSVLPIHEELGCFY